MQTNESDERWIKTKDEMPVVGQKIIVFLWMDTTVSQAWWTGEDYVLVGANEEGSVSVFKIKPVAISHWKAMPPCPLVHENPAIERGLTSAAMHH